jgi:Tol biopolymer transport system component
VGYLPVGYYELESGNQYRQIGTSFGKNITFSFDGQRVAYTVYDQLLFGSSLEAVNLNGTQLESLPERWLGENVFQPEMPRYGGPFKQYVVFVAHTETRQTPQVFLLNLNPPQGASPLQQLTDNESIYSDPVLSPDGTEVIAVRSDPNAAVPTVDLVSIDVASKAQIPVTNDGASYKESSPFYTRTGIQVLFAAEPSNQPGNADIYLRNADGSGSARLFYQTPANDIYPVLSPDGRYLAFASNGDGTYEIYIYDTSTEALTQLTNSSDDFYPGDWWQP